MFGWRILRVEPIYWKILFPPLDYMERKKWSDLQQRSVLSSKKIFHKAISSLYEWRIRNHLETLLANSIHNNGNHRVKWTSSPNLVYWQLPPSNVVKLNFNRSVKVKSTVARAILINNKGKCIKVCCFNLVLPLLILRNNGSQKHVTYFFRRKYLQYYIIKEDNIMLINSIFGKKNPPPRWKIQYIIEDISTKKPRQLNRLQMLDT